MNFRETFLKLTEFTVPFKAEQETIVPLLPRGVKKDPYGNYFIKIGESKTLFTSHMDTYCRKKEKVNHVEDGNIIKTDGTTILGGDNKAGMTALFYLIEQNIPGTYYFFLGEEPIISGGLYGSTKLLEGNPEFLKKFDRAVAFDRKQTGSIISRQMARICCSPTFVNALIKEFASQGVEMKNDTTGYYTDTGNFIEVISECTNISIGVWNEHHKEEYVDISYIEKVAKAAAKINWESLPTERETGAWVKNEPDKVTKGYVKKYVQHYTSQKDRKLFQKVNSLLCGDGPYSLMNKKPFESGKEMWYNQWFEEAPIKLTIENEKIVINGRVYTLAQLNKIFKSRS